MQRGRGGLQGHRRDVVVRADRVSVLPDFLAVFPHGLEELVAFLLGEVHGDLDALVGGDALRFVVVELVRAGRNDGALAGRDGFEDLRHIFVGDVEDLHRTGGVELHDVAVRGRAGLDGADDLAVGVRVGRVSLAGLEVVGLDAQRVKRRMDHDGRSGAGAARVERLSLQIPDALDAGVGGHADLDRGLLIVPQDAEILVRVAGEGGAGAGVGLIVGVGDGVGDLDFARAQALGVVNVAAGLGNGYVIILAMGVEHLADGDDVREQAGAGRNSRHGQVRGRAGSLYEGAGQHHDGEQHSDQTFFHEIILPYLFQCLMALDTEYRAYVRSVCALCYEKFIIFRTLLKLIKTYRLPNVKY